MYLQCFLINMYLHTRKKKPSTVNDSMTMQ